MWLQKCSIEAVDDAVYSADESFQWLESSFPARSSRIIHRYTNSELAEKHFMHEVAQRNDSHPTVFQFDEVLSATLCNTTSSATGIL